MMFFSSNSLLIFISQMMNYIIHWNKCNKTEVLIYTMVISIIISFFNKFFHISLCFSHWLIVNLGRNQTRGIVFSDLTFIPQFFIFSKKRFSQNFFFILLLKLWWITIPSPLPFFMKILFDELFMSWGLPLFFLRLSSQSNDFGLLSD